MTEKISSASVGVVRRHVRAWRIEGAKATDALNGLVTNDVSRLAEGQGCYAAALTAKGKIAADMRVFARDGGFDVVTEPAAGDGWAAMLRKYVNPRLASVVEVDANAVALVGAGDAVASALSLRGEDIRDLSPHHFIRFAGSMLIRDPRLDVECFELLGSATAIEAKETMDVRAWDARRIARGWPLWGTDMDENTLAPEANLDELGAISFDKGCYIGQETVARVHFRGHVNRRLRRASFDAGSQVPRGAELFDSTDRSVGDVRSSAVMRDSGFAIVMARREVGAGAEVVARWNGHEAKVRILT